MVEPTEPRAPKGFIVLADGTALRMSEIMAVQTTGEGTATVFFSGAVAITVNVDAQDVLDEMAGPVKPPKPNPVR